jgi:hypothetical protein
MSHYKLNLVIYEQTSQSSTAVYLKMSEIVVLFDMSTLFFSGWGDTESTLYVECGAIGGMRIGRRNMSKLLKFMMSGLKVPCSLNSKITLKLHGQGRL